MHFVPNIPDDYMITIWTMLRTVLKISVRQKTWPCTVCSKPYFYWGHPLGLARILARDADGAGAVRGEEERQRGEQERAAVQHREREGGGDQKVRIPIYSPLLNL